MELALKQLSECPEHLETVGLWIHNEWWSKRYDSPEVVLSWLRTHKKLDAVPYSVVALAEGEPVGSCCVIENDCIHRPQYTPWVAAVYVRPEFRRRGIAEALTRRLASEMHARGNDGVFLMAAGDREARIYERAGFATVSEILHISAGRSRS